MPAMAPFGIFTRRSFRRRPSTQSTSTPESASAQQKTDMGGVPSKAGSHVNDVPHRKLRHRSSSMNLLKRNRTPSGHASTRDPIATQASSDVDAALTDSTGLETEYTRGSLGARSDSQSTVKMLSGSVHSTSFANNKDNFYDSDSSSTRTATRVTPPSEAQEEVIVFGADDDSSGMSTPVPPRQPKTPRIQLPTPPFLTEDSPTKYGLRVTYSPSPDRSMAASQRQKMTGAGLFVHAATQQRSATLTLPIRQARSGATDSSQSFAQSSPSLPLSDKTNLALDQSNSLPNRKLRPNLDRPFKDAPQEHVAHALPLRASQRTCYRDHDIWQRMGSNYKHPVACSICDGYDAPGDDFMTCLWCEVHVCGKCYLEFMSNGVMGMMERQQRHDA
ncbi:hypothetical protein E4T42_05431 [Aureobasidium subglaciale]|nr:hypothetical protein E4T42_05431 [Aureobasidium subglaciale]